MTPKEYLSQAILLDHKIESNLEALSDLKARGYSASPKPSEDVRVQTSPSDPSALVDKMIDLELAINREIDQLVELKGRLMLEINGLDNNVFSLLLMKRYILNKSLYDVAKEMSYSYGAIRNMHGQALEEFGRIYLKK